MESSSEFSYRGTALKPTIPTLAAFNFRNVKKSPGQQIHSLDNLADADFRLKLQPFLVARRPGSKELLTPASLAFMKAWTVTHFVDTASRTANAKACAQSAVDHGIWTANFSAKSSQKFHTYLAEKMAKLHMRYIAAKRVTDDEES